jgi:hypothetical protein
MYAGKGGIWMSCERLICAQCAGPVAEGRCASCRAARSDLHEHGMRVSPQVLIVVAALLATILVLVLNFSS